MESMQFAAQLKNAQELLKFYLSLQNQLNTLAQKVKQIDTRTNPMFPQSHMQPFMMGPPFMNFPQIVGPMPMNSSLNEN